jgi:hypothetical protein
MTLLKSSLEKENDDHDVFGAYVAMEIRNLKSSDLQTKLRAKIRDSISQIVNEDSMIKNELTGNSNLNNEGDNVIEDISKRNTKDSSANNESMDGMSHERKIRNNSWEFIN